MLSYSKATQYINLVHCVIVIIYPTSHIYRNNTKIAVPVNLPEPEALSPSFIGTHMLMGYILEQNKLHTSTEFLQEPRCFIAALCVAPARQSGQGKRDRRCPAFNNKNTPPLEV